jgi:hypothetical protein
MTPIGEPCTREPTTWLYFVFGQSVFVFVGQTLTVVNARRPAEREAAHLHVPAAMLGDRVSLTGHSGVTPVDGRGLSLAHTRPFLQASSQLFKALINHSSDHVNCLKSNEINVNTV